MKRRKVEGGLHSTTFDEAKYSRREIRIPPEQKEQALNKLLPDTIRRVLIRDVLLGHLEQSGRDMVETTLLAHDIGKRDSCR